MPAASSLPRTALKSASVALVGSRWPFQSSTLVSPMEVMAAIMRSRSKARKV
jgi:hypothetical protein